MSGDQHQSTSAEAAAAAAAAGNSEFCHLFRKDTLSLDVLARIEKELSLDDNVSIVFLLCDDARSALDGLYSVMRSSGTGDGLLRDWAVLFGERWREAFVEALLILQNDDTVKNLGMDLERLKSHFLPAFPLSSIFVDRMKKALFYVCENLDCEETRSLVDSMNREIEALGLRLRADSMHADYLELFFLECSLNGFVDFGQNTNDKSGRKKSVKMDSIVRHLSALGHTRLSGIIKSSVYEADDEISTLKSVNSKFALDFKQKTGKIDNTEIKVRPRELSKDYNVEYEIYNRNETGIAVIVNQRSFDPNLRPPLKFRAGSDLDRDRLINIWESFGFISIVREDLTSLDLIDFVKSAATDMVLPHHSAFVLCILSHGKKEHVYGCDGRVVEIDLLVKLLYGNSAPFLIGKPKIVLIQACQGDEQIDIVEYREHSGSAFSKNFEKDCSTSLESDGLPENSDLLIFYSTAPGYLSYRDILAGSWFIQILCDELERNNVNDDIVSIFIHVNRELSKKQEGRHKQMPIFYTTFTKKLYLQICK